MSWTLIEHQALTSSAASVTLGSGGTIPQTYKTLALVLSVRCDTAGRDHDTLKMRFNGDATIANYVGRAIRGNGAAASSLDISGYSGLYLGEFNSATSTSNTFTSLALQIPNYTSSNQKPVNLDVASENNATTAYTHLIAGLWSGTSAITSISIVEHQTGNMVSGSTFTLYGLA